MINTGSPLKNVPYTLKITLNRSSGGGDGSSGFLLTCEDLEEMFNKSFPTCDSLSGDKLGHTSPTLQARLNTQLVAQLAEITLSTTCN